jgi:hypothetical protein
MATIDATIPLGVRPIQIENPLAQMAQIAQLQGAQQQNALLGLKMQQAQREEADLQSLRSGLSAPGADPYKVLLQQGRVKEANEYQKGQREAEKAQIELVDSKLKQSREMLTGVKTPEEYMQWHLANHADPVLGPMLKARGVTPEQSVARIQQALQTPGGFQQLLQESALGVQKFMELNKPTTTVVNAGGTSQVLQTPGLGGAPQTVGTITHTATPGDVEAARHHGVIEQQGAANLSRPFELTDPAGNAVLVQQDKAGAITPVQGFAPKGGGKPLPGAALKQITEVRDNALTIDRLSGAFKDDFAGKGVLGMGAEAQLAGAAVLGRDQDAVDWWKNYRKQAELVERHALFGASLTPGEQASWRSADIGPGMDPKVIRKNLETRAELAKQVLERTRQDLIDAGHSEQRVNAIAGRGPAATAAKPAAGGVPLVNAKGWTLHTDAKGNRAYVSPDGKQFEEVK